MQYPAHTLLALCSVVCNYLSCFLVFLHAGSWNLPTILTRIKWLLKISEHQQNTAFIQHNTTQHSTVQYSTIQEQLYTCWFSFIHDVPKISCDDPLVALWGNKKRNSKIDAPWIRSTHQHTEGMLHQISKNLHLPTTAWAIVLGFLKTAVCCRLRWRNLTIRHVCTRIPDVCLLGIVLGSTMRESNSKVFNAYIMLQLLRLCTTSTYIYFPGPEPHTKSSLDGWAPNGTAFSFLS